jgi:hypothetical protein
MIRLTEDRGSNFVYIRASEIQRISVACTGATVIDIKGQSYSSWVKETPEKVWRLVEET